MLLADLIQVSGPRGQHSGHGWLPTGIETLESVGHTGAASMITIRGTVTRIEKFPGAEVPRSQHVTDQTHAVGYNCLSYLQRRAECAITQPHDDLGLENLSIVGGLPPKSGLHMV